MRCFAPWKRPSGKACRDDGILPSAVDLFTEIGKAPWVLQQAGVFLLRVRNLMFLNNFILFKYCTERLNALPDGHLCVFREAYSQSYPQILWVSHFPFCSNKLKANSKIFSSIGQQASDSA